MVSYLCHFSYFQMMKSCFCVARKSTAISVSRLSFDYILRQKNTTGILENMKTEGKTEDLMEMIYRFRTSSDTVEISHGRNAGQFAPKMTKASKLLKKLVI